MYHIPSDSSSSDDDNEVTMQFFDRVVQAAGSSAPKQRRISVFRDRVAAHERLMKDYFVEDPTYNEVVFRRRFRMSRQLFLRIVNDLEQNFECFQRRYDGRWKIGFSTIQKVTSAVRQLAYGAVADAYDEVLAMSERTSRETLENFCDAVIQLYGNEYLRKPTTHDIHLLYNAHETIHGFPGMIGSIDVTQCEWRNCPREWRGQFTGHHGFASICLEAVASQDLWIWHSFFGVAGSNNDLNVLYQSPLFNEQIHGEGPKCPFQVNGNQFELGYYLADGIYPTWSVFVKTLSYPIEDKNKKFAKAQESARKDVERAFGVLKAKWGIMRLPLRAMTLKRIRKLVNTCIILHNMVLKDEGRAISPEYIPDPPPHTNEPDENFITRLHSRETHYNLRFNLIEHIWNTELSHLDDEDDS